MKSFISKQPSTFATLVHNSNPKDVQPSVSNSKELLRFKRAVMFMSSLSEVCDTLMAMSGNSLDYTTAYVGKVLNGRARPSYELALALVDIANSNIEVFHSATMADKIKASPTSSRLGKYRSNPITAHKFNIRNVKFAHFQWNSTPYFETTPTSDVFTRYNTGGIGQSMAWIADKLGVGERTLQRWVRYPNTIPQNKRSNKTPFKVGSNHITINKLSDYIYESSVDALV